MFSSYFGANHRWVPLIDKRVIMIMNGPAVTSAQLLGLVPKLYAQQTSCHFVQSFLRSTPKSSKRKKGSAQRQGEAAQTFRRDLFDDINKQEKKAVRLSYE